MSEKDAIIAQRAQLSEQIFAETGRRPTAEELRELTEPLRSQEIFLVPARGRKDGFEIVSEQMIKNGRASYKARRYFESKKEPKRQF